MKSEKITRTAAPAARWYADACAAAHALDLLGERWSLLVMRELIFGPRRFGELRAGLPGISANVLTQRLEGLEAAGVLRRRRLPPPASVQAYELTEWGLESERIFLSLGRWAARSPAHDPSLPLSAASLMLSLRAMLDPGKASGLSARVGFRLGEDGFLAELDEGRITLRRGPVEDAAVVFEGAPKAVAAALYGGRTLEALEAAGLLRVEGDRALARRFAGLFPLPPKAG